MGSDSSLSETTGPAAKGHFRFQPATKVCWPIVWLWTLSISQYCYRYILQVNDPSTSHQYNATPAVLSALKYAVFLIFWLYALIRFVHRPIVVRKGLVTPSILTLLSLFALLLVYLIRVAFMPGDLIDTTICGAELLPWMSSVFLVPLIFQKDHSLTRTLMTFERLIFWIAFPFWAMTIALAAAGIRYPALSYPGLLVRFGGILDDPNGYACLALFLLTLSTTIRNAAWRVRSLIYVFMLIGTLSLTGYTTALIMLLLCGLLRFLKNSPSGSRS